jgi:hypothetical protein
MRPRRREAATAREGVSLQIVTTGLDPVVDAEGQLVTTGLDPVVHAEMD